jgi:hypothetical protein
VWDLRGYLECDGDIIRGRSRGEPYRVVEQDLMGPGLDQERRKSAQIGEDRADELV